MQTAIDFRLVRGAGPQSLTDLANRVRQQPRVTRQQQLPAIGKGFAGASPGGSGPTPPPPGPPVPPITGGLQFFWMSGFEQFTDDACTVPATADADPVECWHDLTGNGHHGTQSTLADAGTLKLNLQNGRSGVRFDGLSDRYNLVSISLGTTHTWLLAGRVAVINGATNGILLSGGSTHYFGYIGNTNLNYFDAVDAVGVTHGLVNGDKFIMGNRRNGTTVRFRKNGAQLGADQTLSTNPPLALDCVGGYADGSFPTNGDDYALLVYDSALSDGDWATMDTWLNSLYEIY